ncbi:hypothetical protein [Streptomyces sp. NPDC059271]|uniref:hypothetical protein n=1 Tax=Streptomyces sp. NPDC059271 TaxID=3346799 RepID=UPI0036A81C77
MTAGATEPVVASEGGMGDGDDDAASGWAAPPACVITADGTYGARLTSDGESWYPERWTLDGPEPYAVPLPSHQPEEPGTEVLPLTDGRVLIHRVADGRHAFSLLYPTGPGTGELPLGAVECPDPGTRLRLLPPAPDGERAYALAVGRGSTAVWLVAGGAFGPEHLAEIPGHCSGGVWLDGSGRLLALDRFHGGRTKTVVVDLERGGEVSPLLQIAERSNDRLLLADADSGLLLIRSDAPSPGRERLGWGVLGSTLPVRFPECLTATGCSITPFAIQPGQVLTPEACAVALRIDGPGGTWVGMWRPSERRIDHRPVPEGWLAGTGLWTREGVLHLPYANGGVPCGVARLQVSTGAREPERGDPAPSERPAPRPVPLQQASLHGRLATSRNPVVSAGPVLRTSDAHPARQADATRRPPRTDADHVPPAAGVHRHTAAPEPRRAETPGPREPGAQTPGPVSEGAMSPGAVSPGAVSPGAVSAGAVTSGAGTSTVGAPAAGAPGPGPRLLAVPVEVQRTPAPTPYADSTTDATTDADARPAERERPVSPVAPEPAEPRRPRPGLWTKVAATPPPGRSLGAGFVASLPLEVEVGPAVTHGGPELPLGQNDFSEPELPLGPGERAAFDGRALPPEPQQQAAFGGRERPLGPQEQADFGGGAPPLETSDFGGGEPPLERTAFDRAGLPMEQSETGASPHPSDHRQLPIPAPLPASAPLPVSAPLPDHRQPPISAQPAGTPGTPEFTGAPEFTGFTRIADSPGSGSFADFTAFRGETPLRSFEPQQLPPEQPWRDAPPAHPQVPAHDAGWSPETSPSPEGPENAGSPGGPDRTESPDRPDHQAVSARRTPPTHRRPLHAGPPTPVEQASGGEIAPPGVAAPDAASPGDPASAAPGGGEETGGEDEETSPSATRAMTAR